MTTVHLNDEFMIDTQPRSWDGTILMEHLLDRLIPRTDQEQLNVHTLWALLLTHPELLGNRPLFGERLQTAVAVLMDHNDLSPLTRRELSDVSYAARAAQR
ncbi:hypothetical protein [Pseudonocardia spinosispora]|uniref:hypothetical protein n=1 Tax=Pseudonocardia spinosispora TaxID=103441 RepID=UPI00068832F3|nr:hypothetical protein [Pseudonocardia spinosispora]